MQAEATINLLESVTLSLEEATEGRILTFEIQSSLHKPTGEFSNGQDEELCGEDSIIGNSMCPHLWWDISWMWLKVRRSRIETGGELGQSIGKMVCDRDEWDSIVMGNAHSKKAMRMSSHRKPARGAANHASKHAIAASYPTIQSTSVPVRRCGGPLFCG